MQNKKIVIIAFNHQSVEVAYKIAIEERKIIPNWPIDQSHWDGKMEANIENCKQSICFSIDQD